MKSQPTNISFDEVRYVLLHLGFEQNDRNGGSHYVFYNPVTHKRLTVPKHKPIKENYIKALYCVFDLEEKE
jgi:predicted RNA binding protein YcfA (HicA-like mRNA interferase family)